MLFAGGVHLYQFFDLLQIDSIQLKDLNYSYIIQIICTQLKGCKYS